MDPKNLIFAAVATGVLTGVGVFTYSAGPVKPPPPIINGRPVVDAGIEHFVDPVRCTQQMVDVGATAVEECPYGLAEVL